MDTCMWGGGREVLKAAGHDIVWAGGWDIDPADDDILTHAYREGHVLVTLGRDFGERAIVHGEPHAGILRLVNWSASQQASICLTMLIRYGAELQAGAIVTVEPGRVRVRPADGPPESR